MPSPCAPKTPQEAGYTTWEALRLAAAAFPHLRPCPARLGSTGLPQYIYRSTCKKCPRYTGEQA